MRYLLLLPAVTATLLVACASHNGVYSPDCIAFAGDRIELDNGKFVWDKFTDQVRVTEEGEVIDRYPDYPVSGRYELDGARVIFHASTAMELPDRYLVERNKQIYLLTAEQHDTWTDTGQIASCALMLGTHP
jgi:hypothetical protein